MQTAVEQEILSTAREHDKRKKEKGRETRSGQELRDVLPHDLVRLVHEHVLCRIVDQLHHSLDTQHKASVGGGGQHAVRKITNR